MNDSNNTANSVFHITITTLPQHYFVMENNGSYSGSYIEALDIIASNVGFTYTLNPPRSPEWGVRQANGSWTGMIAELVEDRADMALSLFSLSKDRLSAVDYTHYLEITPWTIVSSNKRTTYSSILIDSFSVNVWICWICCLLLITTVFSFKHLITQGAVKLCTVFQIVFHIVASQFRHSSHHHKSLVIHCGFVLLASWWMFTTLITSVYVSKLYVKLLKGSPADTMDTLNALIDDPHAHVYLIDGTHSVDFFRNSNNTKYSLVNEKIQSIKGGYVKYKNWPDIVQQPNTYVITNTRESDLSFISGNDIYNSKELFNYMIVAFVVRKTLPSDVKRRIDNAIVRLHENGVWNKLRHKYSTFYRRINNVYDKESHQVKALKIETVESVFYLFALSVAVGCVSLVFEIGISIFNTNIANMIMQECPLKN